MKIGIIGGGIAGMSAAYKLADRHEVILFEAAPLLGGHTATRDVECGEEVLPIDTGFIVFNDWTYPHFIALMDELGVASLPTSMSFSVSDRASGLEYAGSNLNTLFAQRRNLLSPRFIGLLREIVHFNDNAERHLSRDAAVADMTLGEYLQSFSYSASFRDLYLVPMGAAIWSSSQDNMLNIPLRFFLRFFRNHGLLNIKNRPQWRVIKGGSREYIAPLTRKYRHNIRLNCAVQSIIRAQDDAGRPVVEVSSSQGRDYFDHVVVACHSDQALAILGDASEAEKSVLGSIPYFNNEVALHHDTRLLPSNRRCWSSWNVCLNDGDNS
ncbi:MAG: FAD-dependent oxidoreductase, partial [Pseudohongiellaceae bacterium]